MLFHIFTEFSFLAFVTSLKKGRRRAHPKDLIWILAPPTVPLSFCLLLLSSHWKLPFGSASNFSFFDSQFHRFLFGNLLTEPSVCSSYEPTGHPVQGEPLLSAPLGLCCVAYVQLEEAKDQTRSVRSVHVARAAWLLRVARSPLLLFSSTPVPFPLAPHMWNSHEQETRKGFLENLLSRKFLSHPKPIS